MKKISILSVFLLLFASLSFVSCDVEPIDSAVLNQNDTTDNGNPDGGADNTGGGGNNTGGGSSTCTIPSNLTAIRSGLPTNAELSWQPGGSEAAWEVQYGVSGFSLGSGTIVSANYFTKIINGLSASGYDFYVRAKCSSTDSSAWLGPVSIDPYTVNNSPALMTANIDGTQYNNMRPYLYSSIGIDVIVENDGAPAGDMRYLKIQGVTSDVIGSQFVINLHIPEDKWVNGTYDLYETFDISGPSYCQADLVLPYITAGLPDYQSVTAGSITVTEFNLSTKRIKGNFNITYTKSSNGLDYYITNGTFDYGLDDDYFN